MEALERAEEIRKNLEGRHHSDSTQDVIVNDEMRKLSEDLLEFTSHSDPRAS